MRLSTWKLCAIVVTGGWACEERPDKAGKGQIVVNGERSDIGPGSAMLVPAGARHDIVAGEGAPLKLYTLYAPPNHRDGVVHHTRADAERDDETFDGRTTE